MRKFNLFKKAATILSVVAAGLVVSTALVGASIPYDGDNTPASPVPAFNVFTGVPSVGDESDFLRARVPTAPSGDTSTPYVDPLSASCTEGQRLQMRVYIHNGASADQNNNGSGPSVAHGTKVKVSLPTTEATTFKPSATISSTNAGTVNDNVTITCGGQAVKLHYVAGSASEFSKAIGAQPLSDDIVTTGVPVTSNGVAGDVWGCWDQRVYVILTVVVEKVETPPPAYSCDMFDVTATVDRSVKVSEFKTATSNGAVFKNAVINWGDNSRNTTTANPIGETHQYAEDGTYTITATAVFTVNDREVTATSANCTKQVTFKNNVPPVVTPPATPQTPTSLVNTGPGTVAGLFGLATVAGAFIRRRMLSRHLG